MNRFPPELFPLLGKYVYRLVDPRTGETFYVGQGTNNRCFDHVEEARGDLTHLVPEGSSLQTEQRKYARIRDILDSQLEPVAIIHRRNLSPSEANEVEAALIDAYNDLTNKISGQGTSDSKGLIDAHTFIRTLGADDIPIGEEFVACVCDKSGTSEKGMTTRDAAAYAWFVRDDEWPDRSRYLLPYQAGTGLVKDIFRIMKVVPASEFHARNAQLFPKTHPARKAFELETVSDPAIRTKYVGRRVPGRFRQSSVTYPGWNEN